MITFSDVKCLMLTRYVADRFIYVVGEIYVRRHGVGKGICLLEKVSVRIREIVGDG